MTFFEWLRSQSDREDAPGKLWRWTSRTGGFETLGDIKYHWAMTLVVKRAPDNVWTYFYKTWSEWDESRRQVTNNVK